MIKRNIEWIKALQNSDIPQRERVYRLMSTLGLVALFLAFIMGLFLESNIIAPMVLLVTWFLLFLLVKYTLHYKKITFGIMTIATVLLFFIIPTSFFTGGGLDGGAPIWFVFSFVYCALLMEHPAMETFITATTAVMGICYYVAYTHPDLVSKHSSATAYIDSFIATLLLSGLIVVLIIFQTSSYRRKSSHAEEQRQRILELNRAQNRFFSSMSHEIRTPINTIIGLNEMNLRETLSNEVADNSIRIQEASRILLSLINDILDMSKIESGKMNIIETPYNVGNLLSEIVSMTWSAARDKKLKLQVNVDKTMPSELIGDEVRIKQILINIMNNSIKYTQEGSVTLTLQYSNIDNNTARISYIVSDTGIGIKKENIPYLFSAFRREDEVKNRHIEGTGLGLSIVKQLVDLMGGQVTVNSVYTKGSTFTVEIPQKIADKTELGEFDFENSQANRIRASYKQKFEAPSAKVLIVDDNEVNLIVEEKLLRSTLVQVETVTSGEECLIKTLETHYNIIFMDHLMPGMDGIETMHAIRNQHGGLNHDTPILVLTANAGSDLVEMYKREGFDDVLLKPVSGELLEEKLMLHLPKELLNVTYDETPLLNTDNPVQTYTRKRHIIVSTESVCDLPTQTINAHGIEVLPFSIHTDDGYFIDAKEIDSDAILGYFAASKDNTAYIKAPTVSDYEKFFANLLQKAQIIVHVASSKKMGNAFANAVQAASAFNNIVVIDSGHLSSTMGMMVMKAASMADADETPDNIIKELSGMRKVLQTSFCVDSVEHLAQSGRVSKNAQTLSRAFLMHPIVQMRDGVMRPRRLMFSNIEVARNKYINMVLADEDLIDKSLLFITYSGLSSAELSDIEEKVNRKVQFKKVIFQKVSAASSTVFGSGTFGLLFAKRSA